MESKNYDFSGWVTRNDIKCSDGRTIRKDAFKHNDNMTVPLVWNHDHKDLYSVLGHVLLENREQGVFGYGSFNNTEAAQAAKEFVRHRDICSMSIYANKLTQSEKGDVLHGDIKEVSLVLAGANPYAKIVNVIQHGEIMEEEAEIFYDETDGELKMADEAEEVTEVVKEEPKAEPSPEVKHADNKTEEAVEMAEEKEKTVKELFDSLNEEQKNLFYFLLAYNENNKDKSKEEDKEMSHNLFENETKVEEKEEITLSHDDLKKIVKEASDKKMSMKDAFLAHGITDVGNLFPEAQVVNRTPELISRDMGWVTKVMNAVHHTPFARVKSTAANITGDDARARGYVKGTQKVEEVLTALNRVTPPTTVYKLQKMDRDDVIDITDFDVVAWLKQEMRMMLNEELARAFLIGDGRAAGNSKINEGCIRPIWGDSNVYVTNKELTHDADENEFAFAKRFIKEVIKARKDYKGSGNPTLFTTEDMLTNMLLIEDTNQRVIYDTEEKLRTALRVKEIVTVEPMEGASRTDAGEDYDYAPIGILVNLTDYNVGADRGGAVNMFDDFDINYNKYEYLIETRCSGALTKPYSAVTFELKTAHTAG